MYMDRYFDHWERLVEAVLRREELRQLSLENSRSPSTRSFDSNFSSGSSFRYDDDLSFRPTPSPLHPDSLRLKLAKNLKLEEKKNGKVPNRKRRAIWKGLSILRGGFGLTSKKDYSKDERELQWARAQRTLHGLHPPIASSNGLSIENKYINKEDKTHDINEQAKRRAEIARIRELTLKGHIESLMKMKGLDVGSISHYYTI